MSTRVFLLRGILHACDDGNAFIYILLSEAAHEQSFIQPPWGWEMLFFNSFLSCT